MYGGIYMYFIGLTWFRRNGPIVIQTLDFDIQRIHLRCREHIVPRLPQQIHALTHFLQHLGWRMLYLKMRDLKTCLAKMNIAFTFAADFTYRFKGIEKYIDYALPKQLNVVAFHILNYRIN